MWNRHHRGSALKPCGLWQTHGSDLFWPCPLNYLFFDANAPAELQLLDGWVAAGPTWMKHQIYSTTLSFHPKWNNANDYSSGLHHRNQQRSCKSLNPLESSSAFMTTSAGVSKVLPTGFVITQADSVCSVNKPPLPTPVTNTRRSEVTFLL